MKEFIRELVVVVLINAILCGLLTHDPIGAIVSVLCTLAILRVCTLIVYGRWFI